MEAFFEVQKQIDLIGDKPVMRYRFTCDHHQLENLATVAEWAASGGQPEGETRIVLLALCAALGRAVADLGRWEGWTEQEKLMEAAMIEDGMLEDAINNGVSDRYTKGER